MPCKALQQNKSSIGLCRSQPFTLSHETGNSELFGICVTELLAGVQQLYMYTERRNWEKKGGKILAALHGILGPTGAAVPGENPFTGYMLASTVLFIRSKAIKISSTIIFLSRPWIYLKRVLNSTHSALKPLTCRILICFTMVLFPDSPAPSKTDQKHIRK